MKRARIATGGLRAHQDTCSLADYEDRANQAYRKYSETCEAAAAAAEKKANAEKAYSEAANKCYCGEPNEEDWKELAEASKALADARKEEKAATKAMEEAADEAQMASDWVEVKKRELRRSARNDTTLDTNIINFGGCRSRENPSLHEAARQAAAQANEIIEEETGWGGKLIDALFCRNEEIKVSDSLLAKCIGECKACLPENIEWVGGHEKVFINGEPVLLRKCRLRCMYGGQITILLSGQPE